CLAQRIEAPGDRGIAVAHRPVDEHAILERGGRRKFFGLRARDGFQRRFIELPVPDLVVVAPLPSRPYRANDQVECAPPFETSIRNVLRSTIPPGLRNRTASR